MKKLSIIPMILVIICAMFSSLLSAQEKSRLFFVVIAKETKTKIKTAQKVAIFLNGNEPFLARIAEDILSINLANAGFSIINREKLEKAIGEQIIKKRKEKIGGTINALEIGNLVNADLFFTGTLLIKSTETEPLLTEIASFQILDVKTERVLMRVVFKPEKGESFLEIAKKFVDILRSNIK
ncbi:MAG TPA: hypothetical protein ENF30_02250 [Candidatus Desulfofervidus auxilii]|uniref:FlgO domain-containing protein n=1 Tax=Desulfofervidus auxilii TaxID=1621989 RepID=A0A7V0NEJ4_DESA2|nr:hypothetical protein [Candidatus Desulfofervidus auxilii]